MLETEEAQKSRPLFIRTTDTFTKRLDPTDDVARAVSVTFRLRDWPENEQVDTKREAAMLCSYLSKVLPRKTLLYLKSLL